MAHKKGQGISLTFIVIAALAVLVLVLVASFTVGGLGGFFSRLTQAGQETVGESDLTLAKSTCVSLCDGAQGITNPAQWEGTDYCRKTYAFDLDQDGTIEPPEETGVNCWQAPVGASCLVTMTDLYGGTAACNEDDCDGCPPMECTGDYTGTVTCPASGTTEAACTAVNVGCWDTTIIPNDCKGTDITATLPCVSTWSGTECLANGCDWEQSAI